MTEYTAPAGAPIWFDLMSSDPERAVAFYGSLFGWGAEDPDPDFGGYRNFLRAGERVAGLMGGTEGVTDVWSVYLHAPDIAATVAASEAAGATVIVAPMPVGDEGTMAVVADPAGAAIGFWQPGTHLGFTRIGEHGAPYWFECQSKDYAASTVFYRDVAGVSPLEVGTGGDPDAVGPDRYSQLMVGEMAYSGVMDSATLFPAEVPSFWQVYICVDDVAATTVKVAELGGEVLMPGEVTPYGTLASAKDPMGALFCYASPPA